MHGKQILVVDDEPRIREVVQYALEREGARVHCADSAKQAAEALKQERMDMIVLDIMLPDANGLDLCRDYRSRNSVPILFLSARGEEVDRVIGLEVGADDYLTKPFGTRELVARIKAILRRVESPSAPGAAEPQALLRLGTLTVDTERHEVKANGASVQLTHTEFRLLAALVRRPGVVFERAQLMREAHSDDTHITERTIDTHIRRVRAKLRERGLEPIVTVHGVGYKLDAGACVSS